MRSLRSSVAVAMILVGSGCAGGSFSSPDGPISFEFACKGWSVGWSEQTDPYVGVLSRGPDAEPGTGEPLADYLACSSLGAKRGLSKTEPSEPWAATAFASDPSQQVLDAPAGDTLHVEVGLLATAETAELAGIPSDVDGGVLVVTVVESPGD